MQADVCEFKAAAAMKTTKIKSIWNKNEMEKYPATE